MEGVLRLLLLVVTWLSLWSGHAAPADRVALVIGNSSYAQAGFPDLPNPVPDAIAVSDALEAQGFEVTKVLNGTRETTMQVLAAFGAKADSAEIALVFFSGHGMEMLGENYLFPTDAEIGHWREVEDRLIPLATILRYISGAARLKMVVLDACRDNPALGQLREEGVLRGGSDGGLVRQSLPYDNAYIVYAAGEGEKTPDGIEGEHSPFTAAFIDALAGPPKPVQSLMIDVRRETRRRLLEMREEVFVPITTPFAYGSLFEDVIINPNGVPLPPAADDIPDIAVVTAENLLRHLGYLDGEPQGILSASLSEAILHFQRDFSLDETGVPDTATLVGLRVAVETMPPETIEGSGSFPFSPAEIMDSCKASQTISDTIRHCTTAIDSGRIVGMELALAHLLRGRALRLAGSRAEAMSDFNNSLDIRADDVRTLNLRGLIYFEDGEYYLALQDYEAALAIDPSYPPALLGRQMTCRFVSC